MQLILPADMVALLAPFAPLFSRPVWRHVHVLLAGAILPPGQRLVSSALRAVGLSHQANFQADHRVLNRARWSSRSAGRILLGPLVATFAPTGPLVLGIDETIERRRGAKIAAAGIYRDPVRSSHRHFVKVRGLRWVCLMLLVPVPWAARVWALPLLTVLAPSERMAQRQRRRYKPLTSWARQMIRQVHRWQPARALVVVGDRTSAALEVLDAVRCMATVITRLRLDARLFASPPPRVPHQRGRPRLVGARLPNLTDHLQDPQAAWTLLTIPHWYGQPARPVEVLSQTAVCSSTGFPPVPIRWVLIPLLATRAGPSAPTRCCCAPISTLIRSRSSPGSFGAGRSRSPSMKPARTWASRRERQWTERAILRTTPALLGLFSLVTLQAHTTLSCSSPAIRQSAWYAKPSPTFADALAVVRRHLWVHTIFCGLPTAGDLVKMPRALVDHLAGLLSYAPYMGKV